MVRGMDSKMGVIASRRRTTTIYVIALTTTAALVALASMQIVHGSLEGRLVLPISSRGIVVPKRPGIIAGLEHSFRGRQQGGAANSSQTSGAQMTRALLGALTGARPAGAANSSPGGAQQTNASSDRRQQELVATHPEVGQTDAGELLRRSDANQNSVEQSEIAQRLLNQPAQVAANRTDSSSSTTRRIEQASQQQQQHNQYKGYSLIELEVRNEHDRRYVQDLYANLSAALNEQAERPQTLTVSPYADIDFWSFKSGVNDQIDIMLSPKSRLFILGQLARARIKHRVKIDDIQARLEQQQQQVVATPDSSASSASEQLTLSGRQLPKANEQQSSSSQGHERLASRQEPLGGGQRASAMNDSAFFENFQRLADINQYIEGLVARARDVAQVQVIGRSSQGRYLRVLRLGYEQRDADGSTAEESTLQLAASSSLPQSHQNQNQQQQQAASNRSEGRSAASVVEQFLRRQRSVRKLGSIWLDGGTHAREWISPSTVLYMAFRLADNHAHCLRFFDHLQLEAQQRANELADTELQFGRSDTDDDADGDGDQSKPRLAGRGEPAAAAADKFELLARKPQEVASEHGCELELEQLLRRYTFYLEPVLNPDGYEYSHTHNRLWRKTRSTNNHPIYRHFCLGADPNRNYDARHGATGSSSHPCSQTYGGLTPFTEPETRHQSNFVYARRADLRMYISFHSYSQMILLPYSHSRQLAPDHKDLESVGQAAARAIERTHGTQYRVGASASILYTASGTASDWAYEKAGIKYSYTMELRDTGSNGFLLPKAQIIPTGEETFNGLLAMIGQMEKNDNLLVSKSSPIRPPAQAIGAPHTEANTNEAAADLTHAPDMDQLRPFGRFRPRPGQLENALDGSDTRATPGPRAPGVRDRRPAADSPASWLDSAANSVRAQEAPQLGLDEETVASNEEPDAGMAFEGEGDLMEPTDLVARAEDAEPGEEQQKHKQQQQRFHRHASVLDSSASVAAAREASERALAMVRSASLAAERLRRQSERHNNSGARQTLGLSSSGRSLINNPPQLERSLATAQRRESSEAMRASGRQMSVQL